MGERIISSLSERVFEKLEQSILSGEYPVGTLITENALSKDLAVSRTPIREAIRRLEQENLVKETPKGIVVLGVVKSDIEDIYEIRCKLEGTATARCCEHITEKELKVLEEIVDLQEFYTFRGEADKIKSADSDFHEAIYKSCGSEIYASILSELHKKAQRFRKQSVSDNERAKQAVKEHREILVALKNGDAALSEELAIKHVLNAKYRITGKKED